MNDAPDDVDLDRVWISVAAQVWRRQPGWLERTAGRVLRSPGLARALLTAPSLLLPWLLASVVVIAVLGLAASAVAAAVGLPAGSTSGAAAVVTFGWLIPMTAVCAFALAVATVARSASVGAAAGVTAWLIIVLSGRVASGNFGTAVTDTVLFLPYLA